MSRRFPAAKREKVTDCTGLADRRYRTRHSRKSPRATRHKTAPHAQKKAPAILKRGACFAYICLGRQVRSLRLQRPANSISSDPGATRMRSRRRLSGDSVNRSKASTSVHFSKLKKTASRMNSLLQKLRKFRWSEACPRRGRYIRPFFRTQNTAFAGKPRSNETVGSCNTVGANLLARRCSCENK